MFSEASPARLLRPALVFLLGLACGGGLVAAQAARGPTPPAVVHLSEARTLVAPSGKARVHILAGAGQGTQSAFLGVLDVDPGAGVPKHRDPTEEYIYVLEGGGEITIDGRAFPLRAGSAVFMPADAEVSFQAMEGTPTRVVQVFAPRGPETKYDGWAPAP